MQLPRVYFDSNWQKNTQDFFPILVRLSTDRIEFGLMGLFIYFVWPRSGPRTIEEILDELGVDLYFDAAQEKMLREKIENLRRQKN